ncbi:hypothetical protein OAX12_04980, partial [Candidatus Pelagibacter sp.]|nr:hypothetical protein [Candidatus Pelagibacter sp.]
MCAISGIFSNQIDQTHFELVKKFNIFQSHRGPDSSGIYKNNNIIFGHNRLSILDLSKNGNQPMVSKSDRYVITFNGEIYNHLKLRNQFLINHKFKGTSDTETLIELIEKIGLSDS